MDYFNRYVIYIIISTLHALILMRQRLMRKILNLVNPPTKERILFANINRESAEKDTPSLIKFLLNYGFYKFGYETCLILITVTISFRDDLVAVTYSIWLVVLLLLKRPKIIQIWPVLRAFTVISIILQFLVLLLFPNSFCVSK